MTPRLPTPIGMFSLIAAAGLLVAAAPAHAIFLVTPLHLSVSHSQAEPGDTVTFTLSASNESAAAAWAGKTVRVYYGYDTSERPGNDTEAVGSPDEATSDASWRRQVLRDGVVLDAKAGATFQWTVPAEVDDHNVFVNVESQDAQPLANAHLTVGDAPPMLHAMNSPADNDGRENALDKSQGEDAATDDGAGDPVGGPARTLAFMGVGVLGVIAGVALVIGIARRP